MYSFNLFSAECKEVMESDYSVDLRRVQAQRNCTIPMDPDQPKLLFSLQKSNMEVEYQSAGTFESQGLLGSVWYEQNYRLYSSLYDRNKTMGSVWLEKIYGFCMIGTKLCALYDWKKIHGFCMWGTNYGLCIIEPKLWVLYSMWVYGRKYYFWMR